MKRTVFFIIVLFVLTSCSTQKEGVAEELYIAAASSLTNPLEEIKQLYEQKEENLKIVQSFASSGTLVQQMKQGATVDLFLSADQHWMDMAVQDQLIDEATIQTAVENQLVLATAAEKEISIDELKNQTIEKFSMGDPESVPAGKYAKETLDYFGIWDKVKNKTVYGKNARQVLLYVESENVEAGFVYLSDAISSNKSLKFTIIDEISHTPIEYPVGIRIESGHKTEAEKFIEFLKSEEVRAIWEKYGFKVSEE